MALSRKDASNPERRMSFGDHLRELRKRLFLAAAGLIAGTVGGWFLSPIIWDALREPVIAIAQTQSRSAVITYPTITGAFDLKLEMSIMIGAIISSPIWLYQIFAFLVPGLTRKERRYTFAFFFTAVPLFLAGCTAGWLVLPRIVEVLTSFVPHQDTSFLTATDYFNFALKLILATGVAFVLPVFIVLLNFMGIFSAKGILGAWRVAFLLIAVFAAIATPAADVLSMFLLALPMVVLYFGAWFVALIHDRRAEKRLTAAEESFAV